MGLVHRLFGGGFTVNLQLFKLRLRGIRYKDFFSSLEL